MVLLLFNNEKCDYRLLYTVSRMKRSLWRFSFQVGGIHERHASISDFSCCRFHVSLLGVCFVGFSSLSCVDFVKGPEIACELGVETDV
jgi:hypothetical protein